MMAWIVATVLALVVVGFGTYSASEVMAWEDRNPYTTQVAYTHSFSAMLSMAVWSVGVVLFIWISPLGFNSLWEGPFPLSILMIFPTITVLPIVHTIRYSPKRIRVQ